jgi:hypothetical protein
VNRLGDFSPVERFFTLGCGLRTIKVAHILGLFISTVPVMCTFWQNICWASLWATFSQTHLVTLPGTDIFTLEIFSPKFVSKYLAFLVQNSASFSSIWIITLVYKKKKPFFPPKITENCRKS